MDYIIDTYRDGLWLWHVTQLSTSQLASSDSQQRLQVRRLSQVAAATTKGRQLTEKTNPAEDA